jgi:CRISPR-associated protein Cas1
MYRLRFQEDLPLGLDIAELRGHEGVRVRTAYQRASAEFGVAWEGRSYRRTSWQASDPVNRALSAANSCLYGICHAAILSAGFSPAIGFIHTGKMLSFVYDIADLYKTELTIPAAFEAARDGFTQIESRVRRALRDRFREGHLLDRIIVDIEHVLDVEAELGEVMTPHDGQDDALPSTLWDPAGAVEGGLNHASPRRPAATETLESERGSDHSRAG